MAIRLHPGQARAWSSKKRFVLMTAGTGGGKSYFGPLWLSREIAKYPGSSWMVVSPTYKLLRRTSQDALVKAYLGTTFEGEFKESKGEYHLPDGGIIYLCSADKPNHLEGGQIQGAWLDEAGQMKRWVWVVMQARLGLREGRALFTTTPYGLNWLYWEVFKAWVDGDANYDVIQFSSTENPFYPRTEMERMRDKLSPSEFSMRYQGYFVQPEGLVFPFLEKCTVDTTVYPGIGEEKVGGIDFGWSRPSCILTGFTRGEKLYVYREHYAVHLFLSDIASQLDRDATYFADPSASREIAELRSQGYMIEPADNDWVSGVRKVNEMCQSGGVVISRSQCPFLISEAGNYIVDASKERPSASMDDHALDTFRYLVMGIGQYSPMVFSYL